MTDALAQMVEELDRIAAVQAQYIMGCITLNEAIAPTLGKECDDMKRWMLPDDYYGPTHYDYMVGLAQNRDSDSVSRSNFQVFLKRLGGLSESVRVVREHHWLCGWVEWIAIHESDKAAQTLADGMLVEIEAYPVLDEDHWGRVEEADIDTWWAREDLQGRIDLCKGAEVSIFASRRGPSATTELFEYMREC